MVAEFLGSRRKIARHAAHRPIHAGRQVRHTAEARATFSLRRFIAGSDPDLWRKMAQDLLDLGGGERAFHRVRVGQPLDQLLSGVCQRTEHLPSMSFFQP